MKILENKNIDGENYKNIIFIRIDPEDVSVTIREIIKSFADFSWIAKFDEPYMQRSFMKRAEDSARFLGEKLKKNVDDGITKDTGEYIVSELARQALVFEKGYLDIPLAEIFKEQNSGNPGFDFYSANKEKVIIFGEAKYKSKSNAYGVGMEQVDRFIREEQDISDLNDIDVFFDIDMLNKAANGDKGYAIAFAAKETKSEKLIEGILANKHYHNLRRNKEVLFLAVNI